MSTWVSLIQILQNRVKAATQLQLNHYYWATSREVLKGVLQVEVLKHRTLLSVVKTLGALVSLNGMIYYYDNATWSEPLKQKTPPAAADDVELQLWNSLFNLSQQRNVTWQFVENRKQWACSIAEKYLKLELARFIGRP